VGIKTSSLGYAITEQKLKRLTAKKS